MQGRGARTPPLFSGLLASDSALQWKRTIGLHEVVKAYSVLSK